jgi:WD40 repeat protein
MGKIEYHKTLANYFADKSLYLDKSSLKKPNTRKLFELPWQLTKAGKWNGLESLLTDIHFLETKCIDGKAFDLIDDFKLAIDSYPKDREYYTILFLLYEAIRKDVIYIHDYTESYPQALFQCLWNSCWWYDCSQLNQFNDIKNKNFLYQGEEQIDGKMAPKLYEILEKWRGEREEKHPGFLWIRNIFPDAQRLNTCPTLRYLRWHNGTIYDVALSLEKNILISCSADRNICIWNIDSEFPPKELTGHSDIVVKVAISKDGKIAASASKDNTIRIWNIESLKEIGCIRNLSIQDYYGISFSNDASFAAVLSCSSKRLEIFDLYKRSIVQSLPLFDVHSSVIIGRVCFSTHSKFVACCGSEDSLISIWEWETGELHTVLDCGEDDLEDIVFYEQDSVLISCSIDGKVKIWDIKTKSKKKRSDFKVSVDLKRDTNRIAISEVGKLLGITSNENILLFDIEKIELIDIISSHEDDIETIIFDNSNKLIISGGHDKTIIITKYLGSINVDQKENQIIKCNDLMIPKNQKKLVVSSNSGIRLFNLVNLKLITNLNIPENYLSKTSLGTISGNGLIIATHCLNVVSLWNVNTGELSSSFIATNEPSIGLFSVSFDGNYVMFGCRAFEAKVFLWEKHFDNWNLKKSIEFGNDIIIDTITLSEKGDKWAVSYSECTKIGEFYISVWSLNQEEKTKKIKTQRSVEQLEFCFDNKRIAGIQKDLLWDKMCVWDIESGEIFIERIGWGDVKSFVTNLYGRSFMPIKLAHETIIADVVRKVRIATINDSIKKIIPDDTGRYYYGIKHHNLFGFYLEGNLTEVRNKYCISANQDGE